MLVNDKPEKPGVNASRITHVHKEREDRELGKYMYENRGKRHKQLGEHSPL